MTLILTPEPLTAAAFAPFGEVIETAGHDFLSINFGRTERYHQLATVDVETGSQAGISIFRSQPMALPATITVLERHPLASQAFIALERRPFLVLVAPPSPTAVPDLSQLRLFEVGADQGVSYHRGVWHHYSFSLDTPCDFLCIDRCQGDGNNCDEYYLEDTVTLTR